MYIFFSVKAPYITFEQLCHPAAIDIIMTCNIVTACVNCLFEHKPLSKAQLPQSHVERHN